MPVRSVVGRLLVAPALVQSSDNDYAADKGHCDRCIDADLLADVAMDVGEEAISDPVEYGHDECDGQEGREAAAGRALIPAGSRRLVVEAVAHGYILAGPFKIPETRS